MASPVRATTPGGGRPGVVARSDVDAVAGDAGQGGGPVVGHDSGHGGVDPRVSRTVRIIRTAIAAETHSHAGVLLSGGGPLHRLEALVQIPQQLTFLRLQFLLGLGGLVLLLALYA